MTHLPDITQEQALAVLLKGQRLMTTPRTRTPMLEAVIGIGKDHHAYVSLQQEDIDALNALIEADAEAHQASSGSAQQTDNQTARIDLKDDSVIVLESRRPKPDVGGSTQKELVEHAVRELEPFLKLAQEGKIRVLVVAAELIDESMTITYPVGQWEPGLIASTVLLQRRLTDQV